MFGVQNEGDLLIGVVRTQAGQQLQDLRGHYTSVLAVSSPYQMIGVPGMLKSSAFISSIRRWSFPHERR